MRWMNVHGWDLDPSPNCFQCETCNPWRGRRNDFSSGWAKHMFQCIHTPIPNTHTSTHTHTRSWHNVSKNLAHGSSAVPGLTLSPSYHVCFDGEKWHVS
jgi:hypothetical protein